MPEAARVNGNDYRLRLRTADGEDAKANYINTGCGLARCFMLVLLR